MTEDERRRLIGSLVDAAMKQAGLGVFVAGFKVCPLCGLLVVRYMITTRDGPIAGFHYAHPEELDAGEEETTKN